jgi:hypothetical protein
MKELFDLLANAPKEEQKLRAPPGLTERGPISQGRLAPPGLAQQASPGLAQQFCIASDDGDNEGRWQDLGDRVAQCEETMRKLVVAICECPFQYGAPAPVLETGQYAASMQTDEKITQEAVQVPQDQTVQQEVVTNGSALQMVEKVISSDGEEHLEVKNFSVPQAQTVEMIAQVQPGTQQAVQVPQDQTVQQEIVRNMPAPQVKRVEKVIKVPMTEEVNKLKELEQAAAKMKFESLLAACKLRDQLERELESCKHEGPFSLERRVLFEEAARKEAELLMQLRQENRKDVENAKAEGNESLRSALVDWLKVERMADELEFAMQWQLPTDDQNIRAKMAKVDFKKKPRKLIEFMDEIEATHPWTRKFANNMMDLEECLDR